MNRTALLTVIALGPMCATAQYTATVKTTVVKKESTEWRAWSEDACTMNFPTLWVAEGAGPNDRVARFLAPDLGEGGVPEQVEVFIRDAGSADLATAAAALERALREADNSVQVTGSVMDGTEHVIDHTATLNGQAVRGHVRTSLHNGRLLVLKFSADPQRFADDLYLAEAMFASFAWK
jgi:hypothetical protein